MWRNVSQPLKQLMRGLGDKISYFLPGFYVREEVEEKSKTSFDDPRSFASRKSSRQELKFITSMWAMSVYQKGGISPKIQMRKFEEIKVFRLRRCS